MTIPEVGTMTGLIVTAATAFRWLTGLEQRINWAMRETEAMRAMALAAIAAHERTCEERMHRLDERHIAILAALHDIKTHVTGPPPP
jgi:hypothetical protein